MRMGFDQEEEESEERANLLTRHGLCVTQHQSITASRRQLQSAALLALWPKFTGSRIFFFGSMRCALCILHHAGHRPSASKQPYPAKTLNPAPIEAPQSAKSEMNRAIPSCFSEAEQHPHSRYVKHTLRACVRALGVATVPTLRANSSRQPLNAHTFTTSTFASTSAFDKKRSPALCGQPCRTMIRVSCCPRPSRTKTCRPDSVCPDRFPRGAAAATGPLPLSLSHH